jgi:hypothetical protein
LISAERYAVRPAHSRLSCDSSMIAQTPSRSYDCNRDANSPKSSLVPHIQARSRKLFLMPHASTVYAGKSSSSGKTLQILRLLLDKRAPGAPAIDPLKKLLGSTLWSSEAPCAARGSAARPTLGEAGTEYRHGGSHHDLGIFLNLLVRPAAGNLEGGASGWLGCR